MARNPEDTTMALSASGRQLASDRSIGTIESLLGAKKAIIHLYNSTSPAQRRVVFGMSKDQIIQVAVRGATWIRERLGRLKDTEVMLQYSPESFSATEVEFAKDISEAVMDVWHPTPELPGGRPLHLRLSISLQYQRVVFEAPLACRALSSG